MRQAQKRRKAAEQILEAEPELYPAVAHIWSWYIQLSNRRGGSGFGPAPISFQDVDAWARRMQLEPTPWEIEQIMVIDDVNMKVQGEKADIKAKK